MDEIRRRDLRVFIKELFKPGRVFATGFFCLVGIGIGRSDPTLLPAFLVSAFAVVAHCYISYKASIQKRFISPRFSWLWDSCHERLDSFNSALKQLRKAEIASFSEMPLAINEVSENLYRALRRADLIYDEVAKSEHSTRRQLSVPPDTPHDPQSKELYRIADKNLAEYRANYSDLMSGIQRTEAQGAVFVTTLDSLRVRMLSYRLAGKNPSLSSGDFLSSLAEARLQLEAIDQALEELDMGHYPTTISVVQPGVAPEDLLLRENLTAPSMIATPPNPPEQSVGQGQVPPPFRPQTASEERVEDRSGDSA